MLKPEIPDAWTISDQIEEELVLAPLSVSVRLRGFEAIHRDGHRVTGSAAALSQSDDRTDLRAWFELLERIAIMEAPQPTPSRPVRPWQKLSLSNGVACGTDRASARARAWLESVERHAILRAWYRRAPPSQLEQRFLWDAGIPLELGKTHEWTALRFPIRSAPSVEVCGVVGIPRQTSFPTALGWGASMQSREKALAKACREAMQTLGFLWGEKISDGASSVDLQPGPEFHQDYYLTRTGVDSLRNWLKGLPRPFIASQESDFPDREHFMEQATFTDLTPSWLRGVACVVRCQSDSLLPLHFGPDLPSLTDEGQSFRLPVGVHPIC